jgi:hypothetical protein
VTDYRMSLEGGRYEMKGGSVRLVYTPYYENILASARRLIDEGHHQAAVLVAHMGCEVFIGQVIVALMTRAGRPDPEAWAEGNTKGFSLKTQEIRELYISLSKDPIPESFRRWREYDEHVELRNKVAHRGAMVTASEATMVCEVAEALATHMRATLSIQAP